MASLIVSCLILGVDFYNIYLAFLHTKSLKATLGEFFQLLVHFLTSLLFSIPKASFVFQLFN
jgi:hypothetical protein